jgi:radical SAM superfamily enzyme YgiQ (UPF0313 family)
MKHHPKTKSRRQFASIALVYPNEYRVGMGNLGFQFVYQVFDSHPDVSIDLFFFPGFGKKPVSHNLQRPLKDFSIIAFSIPFENDYPAVPAMLLAAGIAPLARDRANSDPLIIAGGVSPSLNPEPLAEFVDLVYIGEIEDSSPDSGFTARLIQLLDSGSKEDFPEYFKDVPGVYVPSKYCFTFEQDWVISIEPLAGFPASVQAVKRRGETEPVPVSVMFSAKAEFGETQLIETNRGCGRGCRFCAGGWIHHPVRYAGVARFERDIDAAIEQGRTVGLIGSDLASHPELENILARIVDRGGKFSLSSIRPEGLSETVIEYLAKTGQKTATLAPETASTKLKRVIGKNIPSSRFLELTEKLVAAGIPNVRFYFMIGLPTETDEDVKEIGDFVKQARESFVAASRLKKRIGNIGVQINPFTPKPWTPFQWAPTASRDVIDRRAAILRSMLKGTPNVQLRVESSKSALIQAFLSRADRRIATHLLDIVNRDGNWTELFKKHNNQLLSQVLRERDPEEVFPWDVVDHGVTKKALRKIYEKALADSVCSELPDK